ncbi:MAG TPA: transcription elongation factor GreA [Bacteroidia bacterium]|nr:transcription elongation factor GreA [Sphingobacteriales bacterium]HPD64739.1 transcription elongation factor GreA [Bacteroidia bacterium]HRS59319.1 transcription elongation factor GreA [Bacteroidia bacterium]HRU68259.1 transcription elongation factor GreA [Bacteroidia bacterium]
MADVNYFTEEGLQKLKDELNHLKMVERAEISRLIQEAREKGDLSENSEYDAAKEAQGMLEMRIERLEDIIANARVLDGAGIDNTKVYILSNVKVLNHNTGREVTYTIVSESEADHKSGKISIKSPIGAALMGKSAGDIIEVNVPAGVIKLEIIEISR